MSRLLTGDVIEGFQVQANASPNMTVQVGQGTAGIGTGTYPTSFKYFIANTTTTGTPAGEPVTITTANASNPRIDTIVAYVNEGGTFTTSPANFPGGFTLAAVPGTPSASPAAPNASAIQSAIGASNPYIVLGNVLVGTSVTQINSGNITDMRSLASVSLVTNLTPTAWQAYNPAVFAGSGGYGSATAAGRWTQIGKTVHYQVSISVTSIGTGAGCIFTLPGTAQASSNVVIGGAREDAITGNMGIARLASATTATISRYDNGNIISGGNGSVVRVAGTYEAA